MTSEYLKEELDILSADYDDGQDVNISAYNYFQLALDRIIDLEKRLVSHNIDPFGVVMER